ncbi:MAG: hypothetical protein PVG71_15115, partial [Anaerolineae bacterium]
MHSKQGALTSLLALVIGLLLAGVVLAQTGNGFDLTWWTVDGGGATVDGGGYTLTGTAGQPEHGAALTGGTFTLLSGFWPGGGDAPVGDGTCANPLPLACGQQLDGNTSGRASNLSSYTCSAWDESGPETIYAFALAAGSNYTVAAQLSNMTVDLDVFLLSDCDAGQCLASDSYGSDTAMAGNVAPGTYYVAVDGYQGVAGSYALNLTCTPAA